MLTKVQISFDQADPAGILFFANVFSLAHKNLETVLTKEHNLWDTWFNHPEWAVPIVKAETNYLKPMIVGKEYQAKLSVVKMGDSSITFKTDFLDRSNQLCAETITVHVFVNKSDRKKRAIPEEIKSINF